MTSPLSHCSGNSTLHKSTGQEAESNNFTEHFDRFSN
jgi:hypothetical protein